MPPEITSLRTFSTLLNSEQIEIDTLNSFVQDIIDQCFTETATWGLALWESFFGIVTDLSKDIDYRRTVINAKRRGIGTVTVNMIKSVANSFNNGDVDVIEDSPNYQFTIKFTSVKGIPPNLIDLKAAIEQIKPAHLAVVYAFTYNTNDMLKVYTNNQLHAYTNDQLKTI